MFHISWEDNCECGISISWSQILLSFSFASGAAACSHPQHQNPSRGQWFPYFLGRGFLWFVSCVGGDATWRKCRVGSAVLLRTEEEYERKCRMEEENQNNDITWVPSHCWQGVFCTLSPVSHFLWSWFSHICLNCSACAIGRVMIIFITVLSGLVQVSFCSKSKNLENS